MTSSMSSDVIDVLSIRPFNTVDARVVTGMSRYMPPNPPTGVRTGSQITASYMGSECFLRFAAEAAADDQSLDVS